MPLGRIIAFVQNRLKPDVFRALVYGKTMVVSQGLALVTVSVIIWFLGNENFGAYQYALGWAGITLLLGQFGTDAASFREFSLPLRHACGALPRILLARTGGILASVVVMWTLIRVRVVPLPESLFLAVAATAVSESLLRIGTTWHRARHLAWADFWTTSLRSLVVFGLVLTVVPGMPDAFGVALAYGAGALMILASLLWQWRRIIKAGWRTGFRWSGILSPSLFYLEVAGNLTLTLPVLILGMRQMLAEAGCFSAYYKYIFPFCLAPTLVVQSIQPSMTQAFSRGTALGPMARRGTKLVLCAGGLGMLGAAAIGGPMIVWLGHQRPLDFHLFLILITLPMVFGFAVFVGAVLLAMRLDRLFIISRSAGICAFFLVNLFPLGASATKAAAAGLVAAFGCEAVCGAFMASRALPRRDRRF